MPYARGDEDRRAWGAPVSERATGSVQDLYALAPEDFIAARDSLARELKDAGRADEAAAVKKLRRPSVVAWAVNGAAREHPADVEALLEAGRELRRAQRKTLSVAGTDELRRATEARRTVIQRLADAAVAAVGDRGGGHRDAIEGTLTAASVDDQLAQRLQEGTLEREARPAAGFGAVEGFEVLTGGAAEDEEADETPAARREAERERDRVAREAERRAAAAERSAERAAERAAQLKEKAAEATAAAKEADAEAKRLADEARTERKRADRAARDAG
jgi:hypothetical protein